MATGARADSPKKLADRRTLRRVVMEFPQNFYWWTVHQAVQGQQQEVCQTFMQFDQIIIKPTILLEDLVEIKPSLLP
jgi:hypothetical protein